MAETSWLLLHGTPLTPAVWDSVRPLLEPVRPVHAPALAVPSSADGAQTELAGRVLDELPAGAGGLHVVGHSFGGQVAIEVVLQAPERVRSLTILCSRASPFPGFSAAAANLRAGGPVDVAGSLARWFPPADLEADGPVVRGARRCLDEVDRSLWAAELDAIAAYDRRAALAEVAVPATAIAAEHDPVGTPEEMAAIAAAIPGAELHVLPGAMHMSPFLDPADLAARLIAAASGEPVR